MYFPTIFLLSFFGFCATLSDDQTNVARLKANALPTVPSLWPLNLFVNLKLGPSSDGLAYFHWNIMSQMEGSTDLVGAIRMKVKKKKKKQKTGR